MYTPTDNKKINKAVEEAKKKEILKRAFIHITDVSDRKEAELIHGDYTDKFDDFLD